MIKRKPPFRFVQAIDGYHYFRRAGFPRVRLPGLPFSPEFMAAYQEAMALAPAPIGTSRSKRSRRRLFRRAAVRAARGRNAEGPS
jgi:hypothetical protein